MRILYVTQNFPPEPGATSRFHRQAELLQTLGHQVTVLTTMPYYPTGRVHEGYRHRLVMKGHMGDLTVLRVWSLPAANRGTLRRTISFISFAVSAIIAGLLLPRCDVIIGTVPKPLADGAALAIGRLKGSVVVLELCDILTDSLTAIGRPTSGLLFRGVRAYCRWVFTHIDLIAVCGDWMVPRLKEMGVAETRILKLFHGTDAEYIDAADPGKVRETYRLNGTFVAIYTGSFSSHYDVPNLVRAARILKERRPAFRLLLVGTGADAARVAAMVSDWNLDTVILAGAVGPREVFSYLKAADICLSPCVYRSLWIHDYITTKPCDYLMAGKPVLAIEDHPLLGDILKNADVGLAVPTGDPDRLASEIERFMDDPARTRLYGANARDFAWKNLRREQIVAEFDAALRAKLRGSDRPGMIVDSEA